MVSKKSAKARKTRAVKSLPAKIISQRHAKSVRGGACATGKHLVTGLITTKK